MNAVQSYLAPVAQSAQHAPNFDSGFATPRARSVGTPCVRRPPSMSHPRVRLTVIASLTATLAGCGAFVSPADTGSEAGTDARLGRDVEDAADAVDARADAPGGTCETAPVTDVPSRQTVRFTFPATTTGYLVSDGVGCSPAAYTRLDGATETAVPLGLGFQCLCECPRPPDPYASALMSFMAVRGVPGLTWDAREIVTCTSAFDCGTRWPGAGWQTVVNAAWVPVQPGRYRATFGIVDTLPRGCFEATDGAVTCSGEAMYPSPGYFPPYGICPAMRRVSVEFELPASGDVIVPVPVP